MTIEELYARLGANYEEAKTRLMNDALIRRFLLKFADTFSLDSLLCAAKENDAKGVFEAAHSLKGVAGNLALAELYALSSSLTEKVRGMPEGAKVDVASEVQGIQSEFERTVSLIREAFNG